MSSSTETVQEQGFFSSLLSSVFSTAHAEEEESKEEETPEEETKEEAPEEEEEEEEDPEDPAPAIREECEKTPQCAPAKAHFEHCEKKVRGGQGWEHEDCVDELWHLMHCVDACAAPKLWAKLV